MRGRKPIPIPIKRARGNPGKRALGAEPQVLHLRPAIPAWVDKDARTFLAPILAELERVGLLTVLDGPALALLADRYIEVITWRALIAKVGKEKATRLGYPREMRKAEQMLFKWATEYALTAVSRTRLALKDGPAGDKDDESDLD